MCILYFKLRAYRGGEQKLKRTTRIWVVMKMRKSPLFGLWARLLAGLLAIGVVSSSLIWCQESDGSVSIEYGRDCSSLPASQTTSDALTHSGESCYSCNDTPIFVVEPKSGLYQNDTPLSLYGTAVALIESVPSQISNLQSLIALSLNTYQTNLTLSSVRSTILVI